VKIAAGTPAGAGVTIGMFAATDPNVLLDFTFTNESSQPEFPLVAQGSYVLQATSTDGHRGRLDCHRERQRRRRDRADRSLARARCRGQRSSTAPALPIRGAAHVHGHQRSSARHRQPA
jgi:hypothetical protein